MLCAALLLAGLLTNASEPPQAARKEPASKEAAGKAAPRPAVADRLTLRDGKVARGLGVQD